MNLTVEHVKLLEELRSGEFLIQNQSQRNTQIIARLIEITKTKHDAEKKNEKLNLNAELFLGATKVYFDEESERLKLGNAKKSGRRVSVELTSMVSAFFNEHLVKGLVAERETDGFVYVRRDDEPICAIRFITDMGFIRGDKWFEIADELVAKTRYGLQNHQVFFIVASLRNGLDQSHVQSYLGREVGSNWQFMHDRDLVKEYLAKVQENTTCLADPKKQLIYLASEQHPNVMADDLHKMTPEKREEKKNDVSNYEWIHSVETIIEQINRM